MKNKLVVPLLVFALLLGSAIFGIWKYSQHVEVVRVQGMTTQLFAGVTDEQRRANWEEFRTANEGLSESQQKQVRTSMREMGQAKMQERFASFFAMTPEEKRARLDDDIDRMRDRKKEMATRQKEREASGETGGKRGGSGDKGRGGDREDDGRTDEERRDDRRRRMLDHTEPEMRAQMSEYREELHARMKVRGLDPEDFRGGGHGGRPGGGGGRPGGGRRG